MKNEDNDVFIKIENGILIGSANGDNTNHKSTKSEVQKLFHGCAQFIVKAKNTGNVKAMFTCGNMAKTVGFDAVENMQKSIDASKFLFYANNHRISDVVDHYPTEYEMSYCHFPWIPTTIGGEKSLMMSGKNGFAYFVTTVDVPDIKCDKKLVIEKISGDFDVYIKGTMVYSSNGFYKGDCLLDIDSENNNISQIGIVFKLNGEDCGISGNIYVETK